MTTRLTEKECDEELFKILLKRWREKGSHKGNSLWQRINQLTGLGDFTEHDYDNDLRTN